MNIKHLENKKILITGGTGFVGRSVIHLLLNNDLNVKIYCYGRSIEKIKSIFGNNVFAIDNFINIKPDYIIHAACPTQSILLKEKPIEVIDDIFNLTKKCLNLAKENNSRFLYLSSMEIYDGINGYVNEENIASFDLFNSRNSYPLGKMFSEFLVNQYRNEYNVDTCIIRLSNIFGPGIEKNDKKFYSMVFNSCLNNIPIILNSDGLKTHNSCYIKDAVNKILNIMLSKIQTTINVTNESYTMSINDVCSTIINVTNSKSKIEHKILNDLYPKNSNHTISGQKFKSFFPEYIETDFKTAIIETMNYFKN